MRPFLGVWVSLLLSAHVAVAGSASLEDSFHYRPSLIHTAVGWGMPVLDGRVGWGPGAGFGWEIEPGVPLYVGLDTAMHFFKDAPADSPVRTETTSFQVLPTFYYHFLFPMVPGTIPFVGMSLGPNVQQVRTFTPAGESSTTTWQAEVLARMGIHFVLSDETAITVESKAGFLSSKLIFLPQASLVWVI